MLHHYTPHVPTASPVTRMNREFEPFRHIPWTQQGAPGFSAHGAANRRQRLRAVPPAAGGAALVQAGCRGGFRPMLRAALRLLQDTRRIWRTPLA
jgi:hypothetical protein